MPNLQEQHRPHFLDNLRVHMGLKNDAALARALGVAPPVISKIRHEKLPVTCTLFLKIYNVSHLSIEDLRVLLYKSGTLVSNVRVHTDPVRDQQMN